MGIRPYFQERHQTVLTFKRSLKEVLIFNKDIKQVLIFNKDITQVLILVKAPNKSSYFNKGIKQVLIFRHKNNATRRKVKFKSQHTIRTMVGTCGSWQDTSRTHKPVQFWTQDRDTALLELKRWRQQAGGRCRLQFLCPQKSGVRLYDLQTSTLSYRPLRGLDVTAAWRPQSWQPVFHGQGALATKCCQACAWPNSLVRTSVLAMMCVQMWDLAILFTDGNLSND